MASKRSYKKYFKKKLYHYTDKKSYRKILASGKIKRSGKYGPARDATFGRGVYTTSKHPANHSVKSIAKNNWDDAARPKQKIKEGKMDVMIEVTVRKNKVSKAPSSRDIYVIYGDISKRHIKKVKVMDKYGNYRSVKK